MPVYHPIRRFEKKTGKTNRKTERRTEPQKLTCRSSANFVSAGQKYVSVDVNVVVIVIAAILKSNVEP